MEDFNLASTEDAIKQVQLGRWSRNISTRTNTCQQAAIHTRKLHVRGVGRPCLFRGHLDVTILS